VPEYTRTVVLRDVTLREGRDTPGVSFSSAQRLTIAGALTSAGVTHLELVAPSRVEADLAVAACVRQAGLPLRLSGLIYAASAAAESELRATAGILDDVELLMPLAAQRPPTDLEEKRSRVLATLETALETGAQVGVGFPHATQVSLGVVVAMATAAVAAGAQRITLYDTNGSADPLTTRLLVASVARYVPCPIFFHAHNDLGMATANALAAVEAGAQGLDVTVNGLGDRAGNASLEQVAVTLHLRGRATGLDLRALRALSALVERESGIPVPPLAPIVGRFAARHRSPGHLPVPHLFEAYDPGLVGTQRALDD
jgi:homocitrate synthase NifV